MTATRTCLPARYADTKLEQRKAPIPAGQRIRKQAEIVILLAVTASLEFCLLLKELIRLIVKAWHIKENMRFAERHVTLKMANLFAVQRLSYSVQDSVAKRLATSCMAMACSLLAAPAIWQTTSQNTLHGKHISSR